MSDKMTLPTTHRALSTIQTLHHTAIEVTGYWAAFTADFTYVNPLPTEWVWVNEITCVHEITLKTNTSPSNYNVVTNILVS